MWLLTLHGRLTTIELPESDGPILDIGSGSGAWPLALAQALPSKRILATDLTPPDIPTPSNLTFIQWNAEEKWEFKKHFSFIHGRMLASGIRDWPQLLSQCFHHLEPGGSLELLDLCHPFRAEDPTAAACASVTPASGFLAWGRTAENCWALNGLDYRAAEKHFARLQALGFEDVKETMYRWPIGSWPKDSLEARIGDLNLQNFTTFMTTAGTTIIRQDAKYNKEDAQRLVDAALKDLQENQSTSKYYLTM
ncbi:MAG: hypothetical protein Q9183_003137 [Haloplaca sp. 2 TL-2023]